MKTVGYTELQAKRLMERIDRQADRACEAVVALDAMTPDSHMDRSLWLSDQIRSLAMLRKADVRHRTRQ